MIKIIIKGTIIGLKEYMKVYGIFSGAIILSSKMFIFLIVYLHFMEFYLKSDQWIGIMLPGSLKHI
jgi:hypothetical protein